MVRKTVLRVGAGVVVGGEEAVGRAEGWTVAVPALFAPRAAVGVLAGPELVAGAFPHPPPPTRTTPVTNTRIHRSRRCDIFSSSYFRSFSSFTGMIQRILHDMLKVVSTLPSEK